MQIERRHLKIRHPEYWWIVCWSCLLAALTACSSPVGFSSSTLAPEQSVLAYYAWLKSASSDAVAAELRGLSGNPGRNPQEAVKRALVLSVPLASTPAAEQEALQLLAVIAAAQPSFALEEDYRLFAIHWLDTLRLRQQLREAGSAGTASVASLESLRQTYQELESRYQNLAGVMDSLETQNGLLEQQNSLLKQQLDALTAIEQQLVGQEDAGAEATP